FFFQAEDGIRDRNVTGVQTCALPIFFSGGTRRFCAGQITPEKIVVGPGSGRVGRRARGRADVRYEIQERLLVKRQDFKRRRLPRSEERRVGKGVYVGGRSGSEKKKGR